MSVGGRHRRSTDIAHHFVVNHTSAPPHWFRCVCRARGASEHSATALPRRPVIRRRGGGGAQGAALHFRITVAVY